MFSIFGKSSDMVKEEDALVGSDTTIQVADTHLVLGTPTTGAFEGYKQVLFGMGCFWGAERKFWNVPGVYSTQVGYSAGFTKNATYKQVCSGQTGHNEVVRVIYKEEDVSLKTLLRVFWESHNPTQVMRQGNDIGSQYRSGIYVNSDEHMAKAKASKEEYERALTEKGLPKIATEILKMGAFYYAEDYHQQYLEKNPGGYCGLKGTGVACAI